MSEPNLEEPDKIDWDIDYPNEVPEEEWPEIGQYWTPETKERD